MAFIQNNARLQPDNGGEWMTKHSNRPDQGNIAAEKSLECVKRCDSGESIGIIHTSTNNINGSVVWLDPIEQYGGPATSGYLKVLSYKRGVGGKSEA